MFEQLKNSKNEYKDDENIDEFDPAPAPTKDIHVSFGNFFFFFIHNYIVNNIYIYDILFKLFKLFIYLFIN